MTALRNDRGSQLIIKNSELRTPASYTATAFNSLTLGDFRDAFQRSSFACMYNQLSGLVFVAFEILIAISGLKDALQFIRADNVFLVTPRHLAVSVTVRPKGFIISSRKTSPGCVGFLLLIISIPSSQNNNIHTATSNTVIINSAKVGAIRWIALVGAGLKPALTEWHAYVIRG